MEGTKKLEELEQEKAVIEKAFEAALKEIVHFSRYRRATAELCTTIRYLFDKNADLSYEIWNYQPPTQAQKN